MRPKDLELDTAAGMIWSNIIAIFIIIAAGSTLFATGIGVETAEQAALALQPLAGDFAVLLFALGVIFSGFLALFLLCLFLLVQQLLLLLRHLAGKREWIMQ